MGLLLFSEEDGIDIELAGAVLGSSTVTGTLDYLDLQNARIRSLIDPPYEVVLEANAYNAATYDFVKKVFKGLFFVDIIVAGAVLTCQVKTGDGADHVAKTNVSIRVIASVAGTITVNAGTALAGDGTDACWVQTPITGAFQVTIGGTGNILVEIIPRQGVLMYAYIVL